MQKAGQIMYTNYLKFKLFKKQIYNPKSCKILNFDRLQKGLG